MRVDVIIVLVVICYFSHVIEPHIPIYCRRTSQDEYLVIISIKYNLDAIFTTIQINNDNNDNDNNNNDS